MSQEQRFTTWLSEKEREQLEAEAKRLHTSLNFVARMAIRSYFAIPPDERTALLVTSVTGNNAD